MRRNGSDDARDALHLDALYPEMPASFSRRVDEALGEAVSGALDGRRVRRYGRERSRRGLKAAYACAAAFVAVCAGLLLLPALRGGDAAPIAAKQAETPPVQLTIETADVELPTPLPLPEPTQSLEAREETAKQTAAPTLRPTASPKSERTETPVPRITNASLYALAENVIGWYCDSLTNGALPEKGAPMGTNIDTELWYYALELELQQLALTKMRVSAVLNVEDGVLLELREAREDGTELVTFRVRYAVSGEPHEERLVLAVINNGGAPAIVGCTRVNGSPWYDALESLATALEKQGADRMRANQDAFKTLSKELADGMMLFVENETVHALTSDGTIKVLPEWKGAIARETDRTDRDDKDGPAEPVETTDGASGTDAPAGTPHAATDAAPREADAAVYDAAALPLLPGEGFFTHGVRVLGATVKDDGYAMYAVTGGTMRLAASGSLETLRTSFDTLQGTYIITFTALFEPKAELRELGTASGAGDAAVQPRAMERTFAFRLMF